MKKLLALMVALTMVFGLPAPVRERMKEIVRVYVENVRTIFFEK